MVFGMFLAFLFFDPKSAFCKGYSFCIGYTQCKMADFQNPLISPIFAVFQSAFLHRTILMFLYNAFWHVFGIFDPIAKSAFCKAYSLCMGYRLCKMAVFQNPLISPIFGAFWSGFLTRTILMVLKDGFWHLFGIFKF